MNVAPSTFRPGSFLSSLYHRVASEGFFGKRNKGRKQKHERRSQNRSCRNRKLNPPSCSTRVGSAHLQTLILSPEKKSITRNSDTANDQSPAISLRASKETIETKRIRSKKPAHVATANSTSLWYLCCMCVLRTASTTADPSVNGRFRGKPTMS
jgi:hypothetical protein